MDLAFTIAKHIVGTKFEDIPPQAVEGTKKDILDQFGVALAGSTAPGAKQAVEQMLEWGGKPESTVWVFGDRVSSINAAFANSAMAHAWDFDDTHDPALTHGGAPTVPTAFALGERMGKVEGKELLTAVTIGIDLMVRLGLACKVPMSQRGWHWTTVHGIFGGVAAAGRILRLSEEQMINALGLAYSQACGNIQCIADGTLSKRLQPGFAARGAILAALLAQRGVTGARNTFEGTSGFYKVYHSDQYDRSVITSELGKRFESANLSFKPYPCCRLNQPFVDATVALVTEHNIKPEEVEVIVAYTGQNTYNIPAQPPELKRRPPGVVAAQFSLYYTIANAVARRQATPAEYTDEAIHDPVVLELCQKVQPKLVPEFSKSTEAVEPARVEIKTRRGNGTFSKQVDFPKGHPDNPMTWDDLFQKMKGCATLAARPIAPDRLERLLETVRNLEQVKDVGQVIKLVC